MEGITNPGDLRSDCSLDIGVATAHSRDFNRSCAATVFLEYAIRGEFREKLIHRVFFLLSQITWGSIDRGMFGVRFICDEPAKPVDRLSSYLPIFAGWLREQANRVRGPAWQIGEKTPVTNKLPGSYRGSSTLNTLFRYDTPRRPRARLVAYLNAIARIGWFDMRRVVRTSRDQDNIRGPQ
jgi:hypothetical protein